jgi:hypothetical protein
MIPVAFPAGTFSQPPAVVASAGTSCYVVATTNITANGCDLGVRNVFNAAAGATTICVVAVGPP